MPVFARLARDGAIDRRMPADQPPVRILRAERFSKPENEPAEEHRRLSPSCAAISPLPLYYRRRMSQRGAQARQYRRLDASATAARYDYMMILDADSLMSGRRDHAAGRGDGPASRRRPAPDCSRR